MNFIELYDKNKGNYIIEAGEGYGKTTVLKTMYNRYRERLQCGEDNVIPIFIRLADVNLEDDDFVQAGIIARSIIKKYYDINADGVKPDKIRSMIRKDSEHRYLILLDGLNELYNNRRISEMNVIQHFTNELMGTVDGVRFMDCPNLDIVITTRKILKSQLRCVLEEFKQETDYRNFKVVHFAKLTVDLNENEKLRELLQVPMLRAVYEEIKENEQAAERFQEIETKFDLLECYYDHEMIQNRTLKLCNPRDMLVENVLNSGILPILALYVEGAMLHSIVDGGEVYRRLCDNSDGNAMERLLQEIYIDLGLEENKIREEINRTIRALNMLQILDDKLQFRHDMIREYWAAKGFRWCIERTTGEDKHSEKLVQFLEDLCEFTYRGESYDPQRQTMHFSMLESLISMYRGNLFDKSLTDNVKLIIGKNYKKLIFMLVFQYTSILDDENNRQAAAEYAWKLYDYIEQDSDVLPEDVYEKANILNSIGYCANNYIIWRDASKFINCTQVDRRKEEEKQKNGEIIISLHKDALKLAKECKLGSLERDKRNRFIGKTMNNIGACYYGAYYRNYKKALKWHEEAKRFRQENKIDLTASYRCIASDYYQMLDFSNAYRIYTEYITYIADKRFDHVLDVYTDDTCVKKLKKDISIVINAIGCECHFLQSEKNNIEKTEEICKSIPFQLQLCIECLNREARMTAVDLYRKIERKIDGDEECGEIGIRQILSCFDENERNKLNELIDEFEKMKSENL